MTTWIHIGLHKTGTTTLQEELFPRLRGLVYLGGKGTRLPPPAEEDMRRVIVALKAAGDRQETVNAIAPFLRQRINQWNPDQITALMSEEGFSGTWPDSRFDRLAVLPTVLRLLLGGDARVALVVREPFGLLASLYEQRMERLEISYMATTYGPGGPPGIDEFVRTERLRYDNGAFDTIFSSFLRFDRVLRSYAAAFGDDRVHVLPFEPMVERPDDFCRAWCRLLGVPDQVIALPRRNASGPERRRAILARFGIGPADARAAAFEDQFADLPARLAGDPLLAGYAARHCAPVRARAAATFAALTAAAPSSTPGGERGERA